MCHPLGRWCGRISDKNPSNACLVFIAVWNVDLGHQKRDTLKYTVWWLETDSCHRHLISSHSGVTCSSDHCKVATAWGRPVLFCALCLVCLSKPCWWPLVVHPTAWSQGEWAGCHQVGISPVSKVSRTCGHSYPHLPVTQAYSFSLSLSLSLPPSFAPHPVGRLNCS